MVTVRTLLFSILVPGMVAGYLPYLYLQEARRLTFPPPLTPLWTGGMILIVLGIALYFWCAQEFTFYGHGTPAPIDPPKMLVAKGPYRWTRNPMYIAVLTVIMGEALFFRAAPLGIYALALFGLFHLFIIFYEEPTLRRLFGPAYEAYRQAVPRWLPLRPMRNTLSDY